MSRQFSGSDFTPPEQIKIRRLYVFPHYVDLELPVLARIYDRRIKGNRSIGHEIEDDQA